MAIKLTNEQVKFGRDLLESGETYYDISVELYKRYGLYIHPESVRYHLTRKDKPKLTVKEKLSTDGIEKVLVMSDLHVPFENENILEIIETHKDEISTLILGGDIVDCFSISSFDPLDALPLIDEMVATHQLLKKIQDITQGIRKIIIKGNHEQRYAKYLAKHPNELNKLHSDNILNEIVKGFQHYDRVKGVVSTYDELDFEVIDDWWVNYNGMIVCHPITFSRVAAKTAQSALEYFVERNEQFDVCLVAHTHKCSSCFKFGKYSVEIGCLCRPMGYASSGKLTYTQQQNGYHLATFIDGKYSVNESRQYIV